MHRRVCPDAVARQRDAQRLEPVAPGPIGDEQFLVETQALRIGVDGSFFEPGGIEVVEQPRILATHGIEDRALIEDIFDHEIALVIESLFLFVGQHDCAVTGIPW